MDQRFLELELLAVTNRSAELRKQLRKEEEEEEVARHQLRETHEQLVWAEQALVDATTAELSRLEGLATMRKVRDAEVLDPRTLRTMFDKLVSRHLAYCTRLIDARQDGGGERAGEAEQVSVVFPERLHDAVFRLPAQTMTYTFANLLNDACRFYAVDPRDMELVHGKASQRPTQAWRLAEPVHEALMQLEADEINPHGAIVLRVKPKPIRDVQAELAPELQCVRSTPKQAGYSWSEPGPGGTGAHLGPTVAAGDGATAGDEPADDDASEDSFVRKADGEVGALARGGASEEGELDLEEIVRRRELRAAAHRRELWREASVFGVCLFLYGVLLFLRTETGELLDFHERIEKGLTRPLFRVVEVKPTASGRIGAVGREMRWDQITTVKHVWGWLRGPLVDTVLPGMANNYSAPFGARVGQVSVMIGALRLKQWRAKPHTSCAPTLRTWAPRTCYGPIKTSSDLSTAPFGPNADGDATNDVDGFTWVGSSETYDRGERDVTLRQYTYPPEGFVADFSFPIDNSSVLLDTDPRTTMQARLRQLEDLQWLDESTRAMTATFTLYNGNMNLMLAVQFLFEMSPAGLVIHRNHILPFRDDPLLLGAAADGTDTDRLLAFSAQVILFSLFPFAVRSMWRSLMTRRQQLLRTPSPPSFALPLAAAQFIFSWHFIDALVLASFFAATATRAFTLVWYSDVMATDRVTPHFVGYVPIATYLVRAECLEAITIFACIIKFHKYAQLMSGADTVARLFAKAGHDLGFALLLIFVVSYNFITLAQQIFGTSADDFRDFGSSFIMISSLLLGNVDVYRAEKVGADNVPLFSLAPIVGPAFVGFFLLFAYFLMLSLPLAILSNAFTAVREQRDLESDQKASVEALRRRRDEKKGIAPLSRRERFKKWHGAVTGAVTATARSVTTSAQDGFKATAPKQLVRALRRSRSSEAMDLRGTTLQTLSSSFSISSPIHTPMQSPLWSSGRGCSKAEQGEATVVVMPEAAGGSADRERV